MGGEKVVRIEIDDEVWVKWEESWKLFGVEGFEQLVKFLENDMYERSMECIEDAKRNPHRYY
jgi:hypothetical protein